jgi:hypothetical protein
MTRGNNAEETLGRSHVARQSVNQGNKTMVIQGYESK